MEKNSNHFAEKIVGIVLPLIPIAVLIINLIKPPIDGSIPDNWQNDVYYSALVYGFIWTYVLVASFISSIMSIGGLIVLWSKPRCKSIWLYVLYLISPIILICTYEILRYIDKSLPNW